MGLFVMVEVYHSLRLCCAASHELMMNVRRNKGEGERVDSCSEATKRWTGSRNASQRLGRDIRRGSFLEENEKKKTL